ncbi:MAG TPA: L-threonylcarbamoyladenylate synthase [Thermoleophilaceae bacterium]|nr:L-threonylcarbamoyladenylate synthase [Thermoleophilaceae bacterium]
MTPDEVSELERCIARGGVALFPADTVYGLAADPDSRAAVERLYELKGRPATRPAAVMFFSLATALDALPELGPRTREALGRLLPGAVTVVLPNPARRYPLACGPEPERLGIRVPDLRGALEPLRSMPRPVLQSSANPSGEPDARRVGEVDEVLRERVDLVLDGGELPGVASTVVDLGAYEDAGSHVLLREGAVPASELDALL